MDFQELLLKTLESKASDLHITVGVPPMIRIDGKLTPIGEEKVEVDDVKSYCGEILTSEQLDILKNKGQIDFAFSLKNRGRFRVNAFKQRNSFAISARVVNSKVPDPATLGLPPALLSICDKKRGLVLVTGATGSGKSTTLACLVDIINQRHSGHIITLEDPIEYLHRHQKSIVNQREIGTDTDSFPSALRGALRQDPDVILIGEMRDQETISIAITAAETGHLVLSTLHTTGAVNTIDRIIDVFEPAQQQQVRTQLADVLQCVVSQQLVPCLDGGRVGAFEVMFTNSAVRNNIRDSKTFQIQTVIQTNQKIGMKTMDDALFELYQQEYISKENAIAFAQDREAIMKRLIF